MPMYNNYFPQSYQPYQQQMYPQQMQMQNPYAQQTNQQAVQQTNQQANQQIQQSGFIPVPSEEVARNYPVAPGNSVSFKNENAPYVYVKTMGYSPLDMPVFEKFRLVKEENAPVTHQDARTDISTLEQIDLSGYLLKSEFEVFKDEFEDFKKSLKNNSIKNSKEVKENE